MTIAPNLEMFNEHTIKYFIHIHFISIFHAFDSSKYLVGENKSIFSLLRFFVSVTPKVKRKKNSMYCTLL